MRQPSPKWLKYQELRDDVVAALPTDLAIKKIKGTFRSLIPSQRRYERINSIPDLIKVDLALQRV